MSDNSLIPHTNETVELFDIIDPKTWLIHEVQVPWITAEDKLDDLNRVLHYEISKNDFRDFVKIVLKDCVQPELPAGIKKS